MITPEFCRYLNCRVCGDRACPGCYDPPDDEPEPWAPPEGEPATEYDGEPEALGWTLLDYGEA